MIEPLSMVSTASRFIAMPLGWIESAFATASESEKLTNFTMSSVLWFDIIDVASGMT